MIEVLECSNRAMARCSRGKLCARHGGHFVKGSKCYQFNQDVEKIPFNQADRIRAMSDEELAKFLIKSQYLQVSEALAIVGLKIDPEPSYKAYEETLALLQQPAKEEPHG